MPLKDSVLLTVNVLLLPIVNVAAAAGGVIVTLLNSLEVNLTKLVYSICATLKALIQDKVHCPLFVVFMDNTCPAVPAPGKR